MSDKTGISWTDSTWNPIRGCSRVSEGCRHCYAERVAARFSWPGQPYEGLLVHLNGKPARWNGVVRLVPEHLADPLRWRKPRRVFVNSMSDLFHEALSNEQIAAVFGVMAAAPQHTFQVLTKRAERMRDWFRWTRQFALDQRDIAAAPNVARTMLNAAAEYLGTKDERLNAAWKLLEGDLWPLPNVWLGVSVENQAASDERIPLLLETPAQVRFLSCEPLLGAVDLTRVGAWRGEPLSALEEIVGHVERPRLDWIIAGCESGPGARPCEVTWLRSLRDQCAAAAVPFWLKQARALDGEWTDHPPKVGAGPGSTRKGGNLIELPYLDGRQHKEMPGG